MNSVFQKRFQSYPEHIRPKMEYLRELILHVAASDDSIGELQETLKWGEPSFLTNASKSGTTIRIDWKPKKPKQYAIYLSCQTNLIDTYKTIFPELNYEGNRAIIFTVDQVIPEQEIRACVSMALKYHLNKKHNKV